MSPPTSGHACSKEVDLAEMQIEHLKLVDEVQGLKASHERRENRELDFAAKLGALRVDVQTLSRLVGHPAENGKPSDGLYKTLAEMVDLVLKNQQESGRNSGDDPDDWEGDITKTMSRRELVGRAKTSEATISSLTAISGHSHKRASQAIWVAVITSLVSFASLGERLVEAWLTSKTPTTMVRPK